MKLLFLGNVIFLAVLAIAEAKLAETTCDRLARHGYPCESHSVQTSDGYILTMFRIPHSPRLEHHHQQQQQNTTKPAVLLMHCLLCSSDVWVLSGPNDGLPYMLADVGYDVWIGNARGNVYAQQHVSLSPLSQAFWEFSWEEIGKYDLPAKIDYILSATSQQSLHYVGFSQGTTAFMVLLSSKPNYNQKIRTSHLLAPVVFFCHPRSPSVLAAPILSQPNKLSYLIGNLNSPSLGEFVRSIAPNICEKPAFAPLCLNTIFLIVGRNSPHFNRTLLPELLQTTPSDGSNRQILHYFQEYVSCQFRSYDYGPMGNIRKYGSPNPPLFNLTNIQPSTPIELYFGDNDYFVSLKDVQHLAKILGHRVSLHRVIFPGYNHFDFVLADNSKMVINDCVLDKINKYEGHSFNGSLCSNFRNKPF